jgi:hypothetical protein
LFLTYNAIYAKSDNLSKRKGGQRLSHPYGYGDAMPINSQRWFMRKEEYKMPKPHPDSRFKYFTVRCRKCGSFKLTLTVHYDEETGGVIYPVLLHQLPAAGGI